LAGNAVADAGTKGGRGMRQLSDQSNIARGSIIGLARVTPVAIFGLGVAGTAAVAAAIGFREAISEAANFEQQLNIFRVVSEATAADMRAVADEAKALGQDISIPGASAGDAATGMTELAKAGLSVRDSIDAARGTLQLAAAASIDVGFAAQIAGSALNAFALPGREATRIADLLAASSIAAQGEITDMAAALAQSASVAKQANISIDDTVTAISLLAKNGLLGSDAGTSLRTTILRLVPTTKEAAQFVRALGIEFEDSAGRLRPLPDIFEDYRRVLSQLPPVLQQAALQQIFGQDAIRAASILAREGARGFGDMAEQVTREGVAAEVAAAKSQGFSGAVAGLKNNLETLGITLGAVVIPVLSVFVEGLSVVVSALNVTADAVGGLIDRLDNFVAPDFDFDAATLDELLGKLEESAEGVALWKKEFEEALVTGDFSGSTVKHIGKVVEAVRGQLVPALKSGQLTVKEVQDLLAELELPPSLSEAFVDLLQPPREALTSFGGNLGRQLVEESERAGRLGGGALTTAMADEITATEQRAIDAARDALQDVIEAGRDAVQQSALAARDNLSQLGTDLQSQIETLIDTGPIAQQIDRLQDELDRLQERGEQRKLGDELRDAKAELAEARTSIGSFEFTTPEQRRQVEEFLRPFVSRVKDAQAAQKEFDLTETIEGLNDAKTAAKEAAQQGLSNLIQRFKDGKVSAGEFQQLLSRQLQPAIDTLNSKAGKNLGLSFTSEFFRNVQNLRDQVAELVGFLSITAPSPDVVRPGTVQAEQAERIAEARENLAQTIRDARTTAESTSESNDTLKRIEAILRAQGPSSPGGARITPAEQRRIEEIDLTAVTR
jgi:TP901 family phage tail tape measure protein